jgi:hypothetical protein
MDIVCWNVKRCGEGIILDRSFLHVEIWRVGYAYAAGDALSAITTDLILCSVFIDVTP